MILPLFGFCLPLSIPNRPTRACYVISLYRVFCGMCLTTLICPSDCPEHGS
ncbi:hypothetical protein [Moraxella lacunata]|uniref:hypothetical protein n=1 Tax=Moraxella lacunata TaxID=477 RepID=UPI003EE38C37